MLYAVDGACSHHVCFAFQRFIIIDGYALYTLRRPDPPLFLLDHMPGFMGQVSFLAWPDMEDWIAQARLEAESFEELEVEF